MRPYLLVIEFLLATVGFGQVDDAAKRVYTQAQDSVFLVYLNDESGTPTALGSAFLVAPRLLITNAHVVNDGNPVLSIGPVRVPLKIVRIDRQNDLALLSVDVQMTSTPIPLATEEPSPGDQVFAIGNPEGLEKTISQGIVSGIRKTEGRTLVQITSPLSHGSSGGPILNSRGEVIGVAVGILESGQNLNFAVPVSFVRSILIPEAEKKSALARTVPTAEVRQALTERDKEDYSSDPNSAYQQKTTQLTELMKSSIDSSSELSDLTELTCLGIKTFDQRDEGISAARKLLSQKPSTETKILLSYALLQGAYLEGLESSMATAGSDEETNALAAKSKYLAEAWGLAREALAQAKGDRLLTVDYLMGAVKQEQGDLANALILHTAAANGSPSECGTDLTPLTYRDLIEENEKLKRPDDDEKWFLRYSSRFQPSAYEWDQEGDRRAAVNDRPAEADAYERAATLDDSLSYDYCYASTARYFSRATDQDGVLEDGRKCIDESVKQTSEASQKYFKAKLPEVYEYMADVLNGRGAYTQALEYAKESLALLPGDAFELATEADIFANLEKYQECIAAAKAAIGASDGKYAFMHFRLGYCYFATDEWSKAESSFKQAADADKTDPISAFNLALSLQRQGYTVDAEQWFREALSRNPDEVLKGKILNALR